MVVGLSCVRCIQDGSVKYVVVGFVIVLVLIKKREVFCGWSVGITACQFQVSLATDSRRFGFGADIFF